MFAMFFDPDFPVWFWLPASKTHICIARSTVLTKKQTNTNILVINNQWSSLCAFSQINALTNLNSPQKHQWLYLHVQINADKCAHVPVLRADTTAHQQKEKFRISSYIFVGVKMLRCLEVWLLLLRTTIIIICNLFVTVRQTSELCLSLIRQWFWQAEYYCFNRDIRPVRMFICFSTGRNAWLPFLYWIFSTQQHTLLMLLCKPWKSMIPIFCFFLISSLLIQLQIPPDLYCCMDLSVIPADIYAHKCLHNARLKKGFVSRKKHVFSFVWLCIFQLMVVCF